MTHATISRRRVPRQGGGYNYEYYFSIPGGYIDQSGNLTTDVTQARGFVYENVAKYFAEEHGYTVDPE